MGSFSITHWLIFLAVVALVFGTSKLKNAGKDLGSAVKGFKNEIKDVESSGDEPSSAAAPSEPLNDSHPKT